MPCETNWREPPCSNGSRISEARSPSGRRARPPSHAARYALNHRYLWIRFQNVLFGLGAVVALVHDVLVVLGLIAVSHWLAGNWLGDWLG